MRSAPWLAVVVACSAFAACAGPASVRSQLTQLLAEAPNDATPRFVLEDGHLVAAAVPLGPNSLPPAVRTMFDAVAKGGKTTFVGREFGERGDGYRLEKRYDDGLALGVLCTTEGKVLERWHTVPIPDVPQQVLAGALRIAPSLDEARNVSGPQAEEYWSFTARDRAGHQLVVRVAWDGRLLGHARRLTATVDS